MKMKHNRPQKRLITQLSLWLALLLTFTGCAESTVTPQDNTYTIEQPATIPYELLEASETAASEPESGQPQENASDTQESQQVTSATDASTGEARQHFPPGDSGILRHTLYRSQWQQTLFHRGGADHTVLRNLQRAGQPGTLWHGICNVGQDLMPTEPRGEIGAVKPTGWHLVKYDNVDGKYLYNRCHLIAYMLAAENANPQNLITGTRYLNTQGMLPFETKVCDYIKIQGIMSCTVSLPYLTGITCWQTVSSWKPILWKMSERESNSVYMPTMCSRGSVLIMLPGITGQRATRHPRKRQHPL